MAEAGIATGMHPDGVRADGVYKPSKVRRLLHVRPGRLGTFADGVNTSTGS